MPGNPTSRTDDGIVLPQTRVLVVEDDYQDYVLISEYLRHVRTANYVVDHVSTVQEARTALSDDRYDVFLVDLVLGEETGIQVLEEVVRQNIGKPVIILTGALQQDIDAKVMHLGAADFVPKSEATSSLLDRTIRHAVERKAAELALEKMVKQDVLTGLGNRKMFEDHIEYALARARRNDTRLGVMFLDLDRFKDVNDSMGHHAGDALLIEIARRLRQTVRECDVVARIGGDEFTILLTDIHGEEDTAKVAAKLLENISLPIVVDGKSLVTSSCIGISLYPESGSTVRELMQYADTALYESKKRGGATFQHFTTDMHAQLQRNLDIESGLRDAVRNNRLELQYQPLVRTADGAVVGAEALVRWRHSAGHLVMPGEFLDIANKTGLILAIGDWVIAHSLQQLMDWQRQGLDLRLAVNISPRQLRSSVFLPVLEAMLKNCDVNVSRLEIELTEDVFLGSSAEIIEVLQRLKQLGISIAIDDFGTGYSSLGYLKHLPIDRLKIDKSFISADGSHDIAEAAITNAIIVMAKSLDLGVIAEGVETVQQLEFLRNCGCDEVQGFYFSRPVDADMMTSYARSRTEAVHVKD
jgi:diguanylate cyclase (GGDEF)-like protein